MAVVVIVIPFIVITLQKRQGHVIIHDFSSYFNSLHPQKACSIVMVHQQL